MEPDEKTFKELIHRHRDMIWSICKSYRLSAAWTTEDAFHEVLCDLWRGYGSFDNRSSERTWVYRVATNTMITLTRKIGNQPTMEATDYPEPSYRDDDYYDLVEIIEATTEPDRTIIKGLIVILQAASWSEYRNSGRFERFKRFLQKSA